MRFKIWKPRQKNGQREQFNNSPYINSSAHMDVRENCEFGANATNSGSKDAGMRPCDARGIVAPP